MVSLIVRDLISGASFGRHILDEWQIKGVGGVQCSAPLEPSPGESRRLLDDRESLELSAYGVWIAKGIVVAVHSISTPTFMQAAAAYAAYAAGH